MDIDASAAANAWSWTARADAAVAASPGTQRFRDVCGTTLVGSNVDVYKMQVFLEQDPPSVVSTYETRVQRDGAGAAWTQTYESGRWGLPRRAVETAIGGLRGAIYGTLDLPRRTGDSRPYGIYRLVIDPGPNDAPLVFPHNTGSAYADGATLNEVEISADVAAWSARADVALEMRGGASAGLAEAAWPQLLSDEDANSPVEHDVIEVILREGARPLLDLVCVRVAASEHDGQTDGLLEALGGGTIQVQDPRLVANRLDVLSGEGQLTLDIVEDT